jgi:hypothetical protein
MPFISYVALHTPHSLRPYVLPHTPRPNPVVFFIPQTTVEVLIVYKDQTVALDLEPQASMLSVRSAIRDMARKSLLGNDLPSLRFQRIVGAGRRITVLPGQELTMPLQKCMSACDTDGLYELTMILDNSGLVVEFADEDEAKTHTTPENQHTSTCVCIHK